MPQKKGPPKKRKKVTKEAPNPEEIQPTPPKRARGGKTTGKAETQLQGRRRSDRSNLGEGGFTAQLEAVSNKFDGPQYKSKGKGQDGIPESTPINAMAPPTQKRGRRKKNPLDTIEDPPANINVSQYLVLPGTEPLLQTTPLASQHHCHTLDISAQPSPDPSHWAAVPGSRFGFIPGQVPPENLRKGQTAPPASQCNYYTPDTSAPPDNLRNHQTAPPASQCTDTSVQPSTERKIHPRFDTDGPGSRWKAKSQSQPPGNLHNNQVDLRPDQSARHSRPDQPNSRATRSGSQVVPNHSQPPYNISSQVNNSLPPDGERNHQGKCVGSHPHQAPWSTRPELLTITSKSRPQFQGKNNGVAGERANGKEDGEDGNGNEDSDEDDSDEDDEDNDDEDNDSEDNEYVNDGDEGRQVHNQDNSKADDQRGSTRVMNMALGESHDPNIDYSMDDPTLVPGFDISDGEEEQCAQAALTRQDTELDGPNDDLFDVLADHHKRNRAPRAPDPARLNGIRQCKGAGADVPNQGNSGRVAAQAEHCGIRPRKGTSDNNTPNQDQPGADDEFEQTATARAKHHSKTPYGGRPAKPTQMQFYPSQWRNVLESSKWKFQLWLITNKPFPDRSEDIGETEDCIDEALAERHEQGKRVEPGYLKDHMHDMKNLVWEDGSTFRGELKAKAHEIVVQNFDLFPKEEFGKKEHRNYITQRVAELLERGLFLRGGTDNQGRTNNFAHISLQELCKSFYYVGANKIAVRFPDDFTEAVPRLAVALAATAIHCALDEWKTGCLVTLKFSTSSYRPVFNSILHVMETVENHQYHGGKFMQSRIDWARQGSMALADGSDGEVFDGDLEAVLD